MKIISGVSQKNNSYDAVYDCIRNMVTEQSAPNLILCYFTERHNKETIISTLKSQFPSSKIHGCTSCQGIMTDQGFADDHSIAVWGIFDSGLGCYGTSISQFVSHYDIESLTIHLLEEAIKDSGREGELPSLVLLHATSGHEEKIISVIDTFFGSPVPLIGGTAADNHNQGLWSVFTQDGCVKSGISISVFYPSCKVSYSFHSGYAPSNVSGIATKTDQRTIYEIDNRPALEVYKEWTNMSCLLNKRTNLLENMAQYPFGRIAGYMYDIPYFKLAHPTKITNDGGIECFANIYEGEEVFVMYGEKDQIISRPQRVIDSATNFKQEKFVPIGGINIFCAGSMMHIKSSMLDVCDSVNAAMHGAPYICPFTFGEQGRFTGGENAHGNLMVSTVLFHN
ncbi:hypothetical protein GNP80_13600 [Aliivibrio fischeri]|uniref:FIST signal transduction protein n=1 Tax=Aliivibrio fischeri TaxID=668 RepID=UPI0012DA5015|nr:FIST N-terminal domain-containing protein [Aliivibrio fischeri]MUK93467.1 hypothetical protein [Aliivibrio fischeri]